MVQHKRLVIEFRKWHQSMRRRRRRRRTFGDVRTVVESMKHETSGAVVTFDMHIGFSKPLDPRVGLEVRIARTVEGNTWQAR